MKHNSLISHKFDVHLVLININIGVLKALGTQSLVVFVLKLEFLYPPSQQQNHQSNFFSDIMRPQIMLSH